MAKTVAEKKYFNFVGGLNTEAGPLSYPPNTWSEGDNVVPNLDGSLSKRTAVNYEASYALSTNADTPTEAQSGAYVCEQWNSVGGDGSLNYVVVQRNDTVYFYLNNGENISATEQTFSIDLADYLVPGCPNAAGEANISCTSANGKLIVTSADTYPILVTYNRDTEDITATALTLSIRDLYGLNDGLDIDERPTTLSNEHKYNLLNQGWDSTKIDSYYSSTGYYPSNSQSWVLGKDSSDVFTPSLLDKQNFGTSPAPRGHYVLDLFNRDRTDVSTVPSLTPEVETCRPTVCAFYAGRAWYAGQECEEFGTWVLFSQVADTDDKYGKCYQDADPTSEVISDLIATDGGVIPIQNAGSIVSLRAAYNSMLVFADNGVWQILGSSTGGFSATSYEVRKITSVGCIGAHSIVEAESAIYYWSTDGIWVLKPNQQGQFEVGNVTNTTIQSYYTGIPVIGRNYAHGVYYLEGKTIYWAFNSDEDQDGIVERYKKDTLLCLDLRLGSFYTLSISSLTANSPYITDMVVTRNKTSLSTEFTVVNNAEDTVINGAGDTVVVSLTPSVLKNSEVRFMTQVPISSSTSYKLTFSRFEDGLTQEAKFNDWYTEDSTGASYDAYIVTGYDLGDGQGGSRMIQGLYITVFMNRTETGVDYLGEPINASSITLQARWDWTDSAITGKWTSGEQVYRHRRHYQPAVPSATFSDGYPVVVTKSKIRGRGRAVQFKFSAEADKDMQLVGWTVPFIGNSQ